MHTESFTTKAWEKIHDTMCRELGLFNLGSTNNNNRSKCTEFILNTSIENALDIIEYSFYILDVMYRAVNIQPNKSTGIKITPDQAIEELNIRFREHNIGYQFESGQLLRVDSQLYMKRL
jgi:hypothetical protein